MATEPLVTEGPISLKPGIYPGLSFDEYARIAAINFSILSLFKDTPAHARVGMLREDAPTPSQRIGYLVHMALLEPARFEASVAVRPKLDRRTKEGKASWERFEAANAGKEIIDYDQMTICRGAQRAAAEHASAREVLRGVGASELSIVWEDPEFAVPCKARLDRVGQLGGWPVVVDVKTTSETASLRNFQRSIGNYAYAEQAAMYLAGLRTLRPLPEGEGDRKFLWMVVEMAPPYLVRLFECEYGALEFGYGLFREHLRQYKECLEKDEWPGYPQGVETAGLPPWMQKTFDATL